MTLKIYKPKSDLILVKFPKKSILKRGLVDSTSTVSSLTARGTGWSPVAPACTARRSHRVHYYHWLLGLTPALLHVAPPGARPEPNARNDLAGGGVTSW